MTTPTRTAPVRETFATRFGLMMTLIGVAVGLGNVWRFPYMAGKFGGAAFVLFYLAAVLLIGVPGLMAEFALGRSARRGTLGAFAAGKLPFGRALGRVLFVVVIAATGYYSAVIGWVLYFGLGQLFSPLGVTLNTSAILPPDRGFVLTSFLLQMACTAVVIGLCAAVLLRGLRAGIERASTFVMPALFGVLVLLAVRSLTLPGAMAGVEWYILKFQWADLTPTVMVAALGHMIFSLSLGGTFMVVYGSYLSDKDSLAGPAISTAIGDTTVSLIAGFAIIPAVFALGFEPTQGPGLLFSTLPQVFAAVPAGWFFGFLFFAGLFSAGTLSDVASLEVLVAGLTDNTRLSRTQAVWLMCGAVFLVAIPPSINNAIFIPWDLTFGSGMQTLGAFFAVITVGWCVSRSTALAQLALAGDASAPPWLFYWIRYGIPAAILAVGIWWFLSSVLGTLASV
jgi:NSS family neurotransmitter:Na+ symporter